MIVSSSVYTRYMSRRFCTALGISIMFSPQWQFIVSGLMAAMASSMTFPTTGAHSGINVKMERSQLGLIPSAELLITYRAA